MEGERKRGWWAAVRMAVAIIAIPPVLYIVAYVNLVDGIVGVDSIGKPSNASARRTMLPEYPQRWMYPFFAPIHQIDRRLRPHFWTPPNF